jgi:CubicO group peptidase (beta-lactamase class C family)
VRHHENRWSETCVVLALALCGISATACSDADSAVDPVVAQAAEQLDRRLEEAGFSGAFLIAQRGETVLAKGYGYADAAQEREITPATAFWTASVAKNFTAAAVLHLVDAGKLDLKQPVTRYLEGLPADWDTMTVHHLLSHSSGIDQNYAADGHDDRDRALAAIAELPLSDPPGEGWHYSNDAFSLLAMLVEVVSGRRYEDYVADELFAAAGLDNTGFWARPPQGALAELPGMEKRIGTSDWGRRGGAGIASSVEDLYRWWGALRSGRVVSAGSVDRMLSPQADIRPGLSVGYGWFQEQSAAGEPVLWTRGTDQSGENAIVLVLPERDLVIVVAAHVNEESGSKPPTRRWAWELVEMLSR